MVFVFIFLLIFGFCFVFIFIIDFVLFCFLTSLRQEPEKGSTMMFQLLVKNIGMLAHDTKKRSKKLATKKMSPERRILSNQFFICILAT